MRIRGKTMVHWMRLISALIARVITVEIRSRKNASDASDRDPTVGVSKRFITRSDVPSS